MSFTSNSETFYRQRNQYFMLLTLPSLPHDIDSVHNQILLAPTVPTHDIVSEQLLCLSTPHVFGHSFAFSSFVDSSTVVSHLYHGGGCAGKNHRSNYCKNYGHIESKCHTKVQN